MTHGTLLGSIQTISIIIIEDVGTYLLIVRTEVENLEFSQLSDSIWHDTLGTETSDDETDDTTIAVECNTRLVAPHIEFLIEVPVSALESSIAIEAPLLTMERFPDSLQSLIILDVFLGLGEQDRHLSLIIQLIILYDKRLTLYRLGLILGLYRTGLAVCGVRSNLISTGWKPYSRITVGSTHLHILIVFIIRILMFLT